MEVYQLGNGTAPASQIYSVMCVCAWYPGGRMNNLDLRFPRWTLLDLIAQHLSLLIPINDHNS